MPTSYLHFKAVKKTQIHCATSTQVKSPHFKRRTVVDHATAVFAMDKASPLSARKEFTGARKA